MAQTIQTGNTVRKHRTAESTALSALAAGEAALEKQDWTTAETEFKKAIAQDANDYRAWFDLGFVYSSTGRRSEAIDAYRKSVAIKPGIFEPTLNLGLALAADNHPEAEEFLRAATQLKPIAHSEESLFRAWNSLGLVLQHAKPQEALAAFAEAARLQPKNPEPRLGMAVLLEQQGDLIAAEREFHAAAELDPKSAEAMAGLVNIYTKTGRFPKAEAALRSYLAREANNGAARIQLGRVLAAQGKNGEAVPELLAGLAQVPGDRATRRDLADVYLASRKYPEAEAQFRELLPGAPEDAQLHHGLATALLNQRKFLEAQDELLTTVKLDPKLGQAWGDLALAASENKDYVLTLKALEARAQYLPEVPATYFLRATAYDHLRDREHAVENYRQFLAVADGRFPDQEWQARHRLKAIEKK